MSNSQDERSTRFVKFVFDLETGFKKWLAQTPEDYADYTFRRNTRAYDLMFKQSTERCNAPGCHYPLRGDGGAERLPYVGDVCNLCYYMYHVIAGRKHFVDAQRIDDETDKNGRKK